VPTNSSDDIAPGRWPTANASADGLVPTACVDWNVAPSRLTKTPWSAPSSACGWPPAATGIAENALHTGATMPPARLTEDHKACASSGLPDTQVDPPLHASASRNSGRNDSAATVPPAKVAIGSASVQAGAIRKPAASGAEYTRPPALANRLADVALPDGGTTARPPMPSPAVAGGSATKVQARPVAWLARLVATYTPGTDTPSPTPPAATSQPELASYDSSVAGDAAPVAGSAVHVGAPPTGASKMPAPAAA